MDADDATPPRPSPPHTVQRPAAFPSGAYVTYKRATSYFLNWLLRTRDSSTNSNLKSAQCDANATLDVYDQIVAAIACAPVETLSPVLLLRWPRALAACASAIKLRERVALYFAPSPSTSQHEYFVKRLRLWFGILQDAYETVDGDRSVHVTPAQDTTQPIDFANYYDVLDLPDDYFPTEGPDEVLQTSPTVAETESKANEQLVNEAFSQDLKLELSYFFMELDELSEAVYSAFFDVKCEKKTLVEAGVVAKVAIDCAMSVIARLQLRHPLIAGVSELCDWLRNDVVPTFSRTW